ncbi:hypothetical protein ACQCSX_04260 [Pseudarthrobacter sp. P1]|uniref:hypothetical protein n=1 Tax=Pseudarthrobacter sp. P1 TaxID=3418418 RepID=UPI003CEC03E5
MTMIMACQLDLLDLLHPEPAPPALAPATVTPLLCPGCGEASPDAWSARNDHWIHPADTRDFGRPVCIRMNLTRGHVLYWLKCLSGEYVAPDKKCCHGAMKHHKGRVTRAYELEHLREDLAKAQAAWPDMAWLRPLLDKHGVTLEEAGLDDDGWGASCHRKGCDWVTREAGYASRPAAMDALHAHEREAHSA